MGQHSDGGLYSGARGCNRFEGDSGQGQDQDAPAGSTASTPQPSPGLRDHIEGYDGAGKDGIKGCHRKDNFERAIDDLGGRIEDAEPMASIDGVEQVTYKLPKKDREGNPTGEMRAPTFSKTVYDPSKISTDEFIGRGMEAAADAARRSESGTIGHVWTGIDSHGVSWHGFTDSDGNVTSFYPMG